MQLLVSISLYTAYVTIATNLWVQEVLDHPMVTTEGTTTTIWGRRESYVVSGIKFTKIDKFLIYQEKI